MLRYCVYASSLAAVILSRFFQSDVPKRGDEVTHKDNGGAVGLWFWKLDKSFIGTVDMSPLDC